MPAAFQTAPRLPEEVTLPAGVTAHSVTFGPGWVAVITTDKRLLVFAKDGTLAQDVALDLPAP